MDPWDYGRESEEQRVETKSVRVERLAKEHRESEEKRLAGGIPVLAGRHADAAKLLSVFMPPPTAESRAASIRAFAKELDSKLGVGARGVNVSQWAEDIINNQGPMAGVFAALDAKAHDLEQMVDSYIETGDDGMFSEVEPEWGRDRQEWADVVRTSLNKFVHGDMDQMSLLDLVMINNAYQASDPTTFDVTDRQLGVIYEYLTCALEFKHIEKQLRSQFQADQTVTLGGLTGALELNGTKGTLADFDQPSGRWVVTCADGVRRKLKAENIQPVQQLG
ncbi:unnamed protein product [Polarella glacialis]|uniref:Uncharacterized protein n=1 Tax=Polarella glacialis TaxID=89957 RepID=A0A813JV60_POLGL|nr:unnamed protein product [Polarella glacialis]